MSLADQLKINWHVALLAGPLVSFTLSLFIFLFYMSSGWCSTGSLIGRYYWRSFTEGVVSKRWSRNNGCKVCIAACLYTYFKLYVFLACFRCKMKLLSNTSSQLLFIAEVNHYHLSCILFLLFFV